MFGGMSTRYSVSCRDCREELGRTNDPRQAYDIAADDTDHNAGVTARGWVNRWCYNKANADREK